MLPSPQVLFEELAKLQRFTPKMEDYPTTISYDEDVKRFLLDPNGLEMSPE